MGPVEDEQVRAAVAGDGEALTALLHQYGPLVRQRLSISPVWRSALDPEDIMQVTYLEAFLRIRQLQTPTADAFVAWLTSIAQNNLRDTIRALERQRRPSPRRQVTPAAKGESGTSLLSTLAGAGRTPSSFAARRESQQALQAALGRLPRCYAQVLRLYDLEGRSVAEVAATLGRSPAAVHLLRARAMDRLCELLGSESRFFDNRP
jgi:RNA polymerase sigma-70 factor (subfamily 1)